MLADSTRRSLLLSVLRLSSEPAKSMADAVETSVVLSDRQVWVMRMVRMACEREECAFSYSRVCQHFLLFSACFQKACSYLCSRGGAIDVRLVVLGLEFLQTRTRTLGQANDNGFSTVVPDGQSCRRASLGRLEQIKHSIVVDFIVAHSHFHLCVASRIFLNLPRTAVNGRQKTRNHASIRERLASTHGMGLARTGNAIGKESDIEACKKLLDGRRDWRGVKTEIL